MQVAFLDNCIEMVKALKKHVNLHVLIELTPQGKNLTILEIKDFPEGKTLVHPQELLTEKSYKDFQNYFDGVASVHFVIHPHKTGFSYSTLQVSFTAWKYIKKFRPDIMHFETISLRAIGMLPFLRAFKKVCISIHDPVAHSGEETWKMSLPRKFFFNIPVKRRYLFYSNFAKKQFEDYYKWIREPKMVLRLNPYSFLPRLIKDDYEQKKHILFFGRLSPYKGVDDLLKAMPAVLKEFPNERLIIAGKRYFGFVIDEEMVNAYKDNITVIDRHIPNEELADLIRGAKFIVCPYKDATQSGVLMTAFGLNTPVIATNVGSFPEYIDDDVNGLLVPSGPEKLAEGICYALRNDHYKELAQNISHNDTDAMWGQNVEILLNTYAS